ncbi:LLM class flavin-dependent oxidoreductase [Actinoallomurus sp. NBC_01490]|jgi:alkanesulfonate monooxygenase SsuD/methylene tetrahydromethanopterin reductase-like flavin-dependent oxidoreductase (luciferase family)|uniref:LLM class flavin-dependent oxidoreductase n=1 Tax=Actinoallomurus sp. NBC_01490 TaxID=2903557 RepID=UPI002E321E3B|nr:LLM class flavin-dependent oxidoreductase [Actinoallomurus sp. NBC_01490]
MRIGVILPTVAVQSTQDLDLAAAARHAEAVGLDSVWHGDHLATGAASLDAPVALAVAAAATERVVIGASVFVPAIRPLAWAAKQVATLQYVSGGRLVLGVGSGGGPAQWAAAGVPYGERGGRTDTALELLPALLAGDRVRLPDEPAGPEVELAPPVPAPPIWVGNASTVALRRAARLGDGWFPSLVPPREVAIGAARLGELSARYRRPVPVIAIGVTGVLGAGPGVPTRTEIASSISEGYGRPLDQVMPIPVTGSPAEAAERLAAYRDAGAEHVVVGLAGGDWRRQCGLLAEVRAALA